jgi:exodeoxyribonuclease V alpha subunit
VALAAPTGKAAKRIEQVVGREAFTIHRLLGYKGEQFSRGIDDPIDADVLIVDEVSMVDVSLAWHLFRAINFTRTAVVLVGDHNQLPPVGPGNLLRDLIERQPIPTVVLDQVVRQAGVLKENSIAILRGEVRKTAAAEPSGGYPWVVSNRFTEVQAAQRYVLELFDQVLAERLGFGLLRDVQLLTPTKKGPLGTDELNVLLQRLLHRKLWGIEVPPPRPNRRPDLLLHDRVIQTRNNYDLGVMNGAIGCITDIGDKRESIRVQFDDQEVQYTREALGELSLAYALTVHKYQGSQIPCVVLVVHKAHSFQHHRNLFYTGVTRAQKTVIVVGDQWGIAACAKKEQVERRKTFLSVLDLPRRRGGG